MNKTGILAMCECAVLLALSTVLSFVTVYRAPMGGNVTLLSMLPLLVAGVRCGFRRGVGTAFVYSLIQLCQALACGNVFTYCYTPSAVVICVLFDYVLPFSALGLTSLSRDRNGNARRITFLLLSAALVTFRFACHFITGVVIWSQWTPEGMSKYLYSLVYNGAYMLPELILTLAGAAVITETAQFKRIMKK